MNGQSIVISSNQFDEPTAKPHYFQCDCACAESAFAFSTQSSSLDAPLRHPYLHIQQLSDAYTLMFNPSQSKGVVVINSNALALWKRFDQPRRLSDMADIAANQALASTVAQLVDVGLLEGVDNRVLPKQFKPQTLSAWIHVTNECNLRCDYCYVRKSQDDMSEGVGREAVNAVFRSALKHSFKHVKLKFAGGEATLNLKRVFDIHDYAQEQAKQLDLTLDTVVLSNGVSIGERAIREFEQRGVRVSISLDGVGEYHDAQRKFANGQGSFRWVSRTIDKLVAKGIYPFISITLSNRNADGLADTIKFVMERQLPFNINFFRDNDCAASFEDLRLKDNKIVDAMHRAFAVIEANLPDRSLLGSLVDRAQFDQPHDKTCSVGDSYLVIDHNGNVSKCQMEIERPITHVYAEDPLAFIQSDKIGIQNLSVQEKEGCRDCEWKYWCAGGCPALTFRATGRFDVKSPNCRIYKAIYPAALRLEGLRLLKLTEAAQCLN